MTVKDLIAALEHYPPELPVWGVDGVGQYINNGVTGVAIRPEKVTVSACSVQSDGPSMAHPTDKPPTKKPRGKR